MTTTQQLDGPASMAERRVVLDAARAALRGLSEVVFQVRGAELAAVLGELDEVVAWGSAARVALVAEASGRGEIGRGSPSPPNHPYPGGTPGR